MAARTFTSAGVNNLWSNAANWDGGVAVPADGDSITIPAGQTCEYDIDNSAMTGFAGITVTGTLNVSATAGTYVLKQRVSGYISGAGTFNCGSSGSALPANVKFTLAAGNATFNGTSGLTVNIYGQIPTYSFCKLSGAEAAGQTRLEVDTDVSAQWAANDTIYIVNINNAANVEERTIGAVASTYIDITAGLTGAKNSGSYVIRANRNVTITTGATLLANYDIRCINNFSKSKLNISGAYIKSSTIAKDTQGYFTDCVFLQSSFQNNPMIFECNNITLNNCVFVTQSALAAGGYFDACSGFTIKNSLLAGNYSTRGLASYLNDCEFYNCTFAGNNNIFQWGLSGTTVKSCTFTGNKYPLYSAEGIKLYGLTLGGTAEHYLYQSMSDCQITEHYDPEGSTGSYKAWSSGGVVTSQTSVKPTGYTQAYLHALESATYPAFWTKSFSVEPGKTVAVEVQLRKDASMAYLPKVYLMSNDDNPLTNGTPVDSFEMTNSTDTWETDTFAITNSTDYDQDYTLWFVAKNATGNAYSAYDITTAGGGTSAVKIMPLGRIGL